MEPTTFTDNATEKWFWILGMYGCEREGDGGCGGWGIEIRVGCIMTDEKIRNLISNSSVSASSIE